MARLSEQFLIRLNLHELPAYKIAQRAGVNPNTLSRLINGIDPVKAEDERIIAVGQVLGLRKDEIFEADGIRRVQSRSARDPPSEKRWGPGSNKTSIP